MPGEDQRTVEDLANELAELALKLRDAPNDELTLRDVMGIVLDIIVDATMIGATLSERIPSMFLGEIAGVFLQNEIAHVSREMRMQELRQHIAESLERNGDND